MKEFYQQQISASRGQPGLIVLLLDQSSSMQSKFGADGRSKAEVAADAVNQVIADVLCECTEDEKISNYLDFSVVGYGRIVSHLISGKNPILAASEMEGYEKTSQGEEDDGEGNRRTVTVSKWIEPEASGSTPMAEAFLLAEKTIKGWMAQHPNSFPPIVLNITDGAPNSRSDAEHAALALKNAATSDGNTLLFSCHISESIGEPIEYPPSAEDLPDAYAKWLFGISSLFPPVLVKIAAELGAKVQEGSKGFVFNGDSRSLLKFLQIGTRIGE